MHNIRIHRQNRRSLVMKRTPVGLVVFIPRWLKPDSPQVRAFIEEGIRKLGTPAPTTEQTSATELRAMVKRWAKQMGVTARSRADSGYVPEVGVVFESGQYLAEHGTLHAAARTRRVCRAARAGTSAGFQSWQGI